MAILKKHNYKGYIIVFRSADHNYNRGYYIEGTFFSASLRDARKSIDIAKNNKVNFPKNQKLRS